MRSPSRHKYAGGRPPELAEVLPGCVFAPRCAHAQEGCDSVSMALEPVGPDHASACPVRPFASPRPAITHHRAQA